MGDLEKIRVKRKAVDVKTICTCLEDQKKLDSISWQDEKVYIQLPKINVIPLVNKPYVNEVTLNE